MGEMPAPACRAFAHMQCDRPFCLVAMRDARVSCRRPLWILSPSFDSGPSCCPSASSLSISFRKAARSALYSESLEEGESEFSYFSSLLSRSARSSLRRSISISKSVIFLVNAVSLSEIFFYKFLFSMTTIASSLRRSDTSDDLMKTCESRAR